MVFVQPDSITARITILAFSKWEGLLFVLFLLVIPFFFHQDILDMRAGYVYNFFS